MTRRASAAILSVALLAGCAGQASLTHDGRPETEPANDRQILVMIADPEMGRFDLRGARSGVYRLSRAYPGTPAAVARALAEVARDYRLTQLDLWPMRTLGVHCGLFQVAPGAAVDEVLAALAADRRVESAQRMQEFQSRQSAGAPVWDDPYRSLQRSLEETGIAEAHRWSTGRGVRIAVIDTGVDSRHPDLHGQLAELRNFGPDAAATAGRHGTAVAGIIASAAGNRRGIVGVAPGARLLALQACSEQNPDRRGRCSSFSLARALDHAIQSGTQVLNLSLGGPADRLLERLIAEAIARNMVVVAAAAEGRADAPFPVALPGVIAVGSATAAADAAALRAPGHEVLTLVPPDGYDYLSGSSIAAAHVSGIVALMLERYPTLRAAEIRDVLARTSRLVGRDGADARRLVSACAALASLSHAIRCGADAARSVRVADGREPLEAH